MALKVVPLQEFQKVSISGMHHRWAKCIAAQGDYFKGDTPQ